PRRVSSRSFSTVILCATTLATLVQNCRAASSRSLWLPAVSQTWIHLSRSVKSVFGIGAQIAFESGDNFEGSVGCLGGRVTRCQGFDQAVPGGVSDSGPASWAWSVCCRPVLGVSSEEASWGPLPFPEDLKGGGSGLSCPCARSWLDPAVHIGRYVAWSRSCGPFPGGSNVLSSPSLGASASLGL